MDLHICSNIGVSGLDIHWVRSKTGKKMFKCRRFIAIMGSFNTPEHELIKLSPFDPKANEIYVEGKGETKEEALENMQKEESDIADSLCAE